MKEFSNEERKVLLTLAKHSIEYGLQHGREIKVDLSSYSEHLKERRASFVTLNKKKELRGCIGSLKAYRPLVVDVASNAYSAAFRDPRFWSVTQEELPDLSIHISVLSVPEVMHFTSEEGLVTQLRPGVDGLILSEGGQKGTFLPLVWESLSDPVLFLKHLKLKAGLSEDYWSDSIKVERYSAEVIK